MDLNAAVTAALIFGVISFIIVVGYIIGVNFIFPKYSGLPPWSTITFYGGVTLLSIILLLNITYSSLASTDDIQNNPGESTMNTGFIATLMTLLSIVNWLVFYTQYANIGTSASDTEEYLQLLLPANLLLSIVMVSMIFSKKFSEV